MIKKAKRIGRIRRTVLNILGPDRTKMILSWHLRKSFKQSTVSFPHFNSSKILINLPLSRLELIYQLENLLALLSRFKESEVKLLCPASAVSFFGGLPNIHIIDYIEEEMKFFSYQWNSISKEIKEQFDLVINLEKSPSMPLLYLLGTSRAPVRIGYEQAGDYPFINIRLKNANGTAGLAERNKVIANYLGAAKSGKLKWGVSKTTTEEIKQLLKEHGLRSSTVLIGIDFHSIEAAYGAEWARTLMDSFTNRLSGQCYLFGGLEEEHYQTRVVEKAIQLPPQSVPRTAALIATTDLIITAKSLILGLTQLSSTRMVAVLTEQEAALYCKSSESVKPVIIAKPDHNSLKLITEAVLEQHALINKEKSSVANRSKMI